MIKVYYLYSTEFGSDLCNMRYIGQTKQSIEKRLKCHIQWSFTKRYNSYVYNWIRSVYAKGFEVKIGLLVDDCIWNITEIEQIKKYEAAQAKAHKPGSKAMPSKSGNAKSAWSSFNPS